MRDHDVAQAVGLTFAELDEILSAWAPGHGLYVSTRFRDDEVRAVSIVDDAGGEYQMWLSLLTGNRIEIHAWDFAGRRAKHVCDLSGLFESLEAVYGAVEEWIVADGHTRTPVL